MESRISFAGTTFKRTQSRQKWHGSIECIRLAFPAISVLTNLPVLPQMVRMEINAEKMATVDELGPQAATLRAAENTTQIWRALLRLCWSVSMEQPSVISSRTNRYYSF